MHSADASLRPCCFALPFAHYFRVIDLMLAIGSPKNDLLCVDGWYWLIANGSYCSYWNTSLFSTFFLTFSISVSVIVSLCLSIVLSLPLSLCLSLFPDEIMQQEIRPLLAVDIIEQLHRKFALLSGKSVCLSSVFQCLLVSHPLLSPSGKEYVCRF